VVTVYISQGWRRQLMSDLSRTVKYLKETGLKIIVTGDFNTTVEEITKYCSRDVKLNLS
jgi:hypothetical protein